MPGTNISHLSAPSDTHFLATKAGKVDRPVQPKEPSLLPKVLRVPELFANITQSLSPKDLINTAATCHEMRLYTYGSARWTKLVNTATKLTKYTLYPVVTGEKPTAESILCMPSSLAPCGFGAVACKNLPSLYPATNGKTILPRHVAYRLGRLQELTRICYNRSFVDSEKDFAFFKCLTAAFQIAQQVDTIDKSSLYSDAKGFLVLRLFADNNMPHKEIVAFCNLFAQQGASFSARQMHYFLVLKGETCLGKIVHSPYGKKAVSMFPSGAVLYWLQSILIRERALNRLSIFRDPHNTTVACVLHHAGKSSERFIAEKDKEGRTALHYAALHGVQSAFKPLLDHGADLDLEDKAGLTPRQLALCHDELKSII